MKQLLSYYLERIAQADARKLVRLYRLLVSAKPTELAEQDRSVLLQAVKLEAFDRTLGAL